MRSDESIATDYLAPSKHAFWKWSDGRDAIVWADGTTIVFRAELAEVLTLLAPNGLPPLNTVLLLIAASRASWDGAIDKIGMLAGVLRDLKTDEVPGSFPHIINGLNAIRALPEHLRESPRAKAIASLTVFESTLWRTSANEARAVVRILESHGFVEFEYSDADRATYLADVSLDIQNLRFGLERIDAESLELRMRTGLDQLVVPAEIEIPLSDQVRQLVRSLIDDKELSGLARVTRQLMGIVHLPRAITEFDDLPVGGVSDISNRGPLDRLLLTELAQDDETLMVRVAMNEALYLRRESPPYSPPNCRAILIDAGIRMWGVPRVLATAVAMSLCATADRMTRLEVFRAAGDDVDLVEFKNREQLIEHLSVLQHEVHPGNALPAFENAVADTDSSVDAVIITTNDVVADRDFRQMLSSSALQQIYLATVDRFGDFQLETWNEFGSKTLCRARLSINDLLTMPQKPTTPLIDKDADTELPLILSTARFPFLLPHPINPKNMWYVDGHGVFAVTKDGRLMFWKNRNQGARQLCDNLGKRNVLAIGSVFPDATTVALGRSGLTTIDLVTIDLADHQVTFTRVQLSNNAPSHVVFMDGILLVANRHRCDVFDPLTGECIINNHHISFDHFSQAIHQLSGRYLQDRDTKDWFRLSWKNGGLDLRSIPHSENRFVLVFDKIGHDGPIGLTEDGRLDFIAEKTTTSPLFCPASPFKVGAISSDGRVVVTDWLYTELSREPGVDCGKFVIDVDARAAQPTCTRDSHLLAEPKINQLVWTRNVRYRFERICSKQGRLILVTRKRKHLTIVRAASRDRLVLAHGLLASETRRGFRPIKGPTGTRYRLTVATWDDGSRAFLDSRGMLHLKSSDTTLPDMSLVLHDNGVAVWCSNGWMFGPEYFLGDEGNATIEQIEDLLSKFVARLR